MTNKIEPVHPPVGRLARGDPIAKAITGIDNMVAEAIINTANNVKQVMGKDENDASEDHRVISASCSAYVYGTMYVMVELYRDLGHDDKASVDKALEYINTAGAMVGKHIAPKETEH